MPRLSTHKSLFFCSFVVFGVILKLIFDQIYQTSRIIIDEEFHLAQGLDYCNLKFNTWNPKITTLPGLYLISVLILAPFNLCTIYWLRFTNFLATLLNFYLFYLWFSTNNKSPWKNLLSTVNVSLLPPLFFFTTVYYTDVLATTSILLLLILHKKEKHFWASFVGFISVIIRQTNIIWVASVFGQYVLSNVIKASSKQHSKQTIDIQDIKSFLCNLRSGFPIKQIGLDVWLNSFLYGSVIISFLVFVAVNDGIVVGDKTAHNASLHVPQLFYFSLFCVAFAWPFFLPRVLPFFQMVIKRKLFSLILVLCFGAIVYFNTIVHPYLLADNRHYTFYIWNRFYEKYFWFRYLMIVVYYFGFYCIVSSLCSIKDALFLASYAVSVALVLSLQKMIEIRYFLIPFVLFRLQLKNPHFYQLLLEALYYCIVNFVVFKVFFTKDIFWSDFDYPQKLIW